MSDLSIGIEETAGLISWHVGVWHDLGYAEPPAPGCKPIPPPGERSPAAIQGAREAIKAIGGLSARLTALREQLARELRQDELIRGGSMPCCRCGIEPVERPGARKESGTPAATALYCCACVDRCHEATDFAHVCVICASAEELASGLVSGADAAWREAVRQAAARAREGAMTPDPRDCSCTCACIRTGLHDDSGPAGWCDQCRMDLHSGGAW